MDTQQNDRAFTSQANYLQKDTSLEVERVQNTKGEDNNVYALFALHYSSLSHQLLIVNVQLNKCQG